MNSMLSAYEAEEEKNPEFSDLQAKKCRQEPLVIKNAGQLLADFPHIQPAAIL